MLPEGVVDLMALVLVAFDEESILGGGLCAANPGSLLQSSIPRFRHHVGHLQGRCSNKQTPPHKTRTFVTESLAIQGGTWLGENCCLFCGLG